MILTAEVGEGHVTAARALAEELSTERPDADVVLLDALAALGPFLRYVLRDAYRWQLGRAAWVFGLLFSAFSALAPLRALGRLGLALFGGRGLLRALVQQQPDLVVSTYPAATSVLGSLRRRGLLSAPTCATVTDLVGLDFWAHRWVDRHLVMHDSSVRAVERVAGRGSVYRARPPIAASFFEPLPRDVARRRLSLPPEAPVVLLSGGGWGVGDFRGALDTCLAIPGVIVVCLAGRNERLRRELAHEYGAEPRVRVLGFTNRMRDLLAAADVLIHSTGGVTCLEALVCGCPVIAYGAPPGHSPRAARTMAEQGLAAAADTPVELAAALSDALAETPLERSRLRPAPSCASLALATAPRGRRPAASWQARVVRVAALAAVAAGAVGWTFLSEDAYPLARRMLELDGVVRIATTRPEVAVIVRAPPVVVDDLLPPLTRSGARVSFAFGAAPEASLLRELQAAGAQPLVELERGTFTRWYDTEDDLASDARRLRVDRNAFYLAPASGLTLAQHLLARDIGADPIVGRWRLGPKLQRPRPRFSRGDVLVISLGPTVARARRTLNALLTTLASQRLRAVSVQRLAGGRPHESD